MGGDITLLSSGRKPQKGQRSHKKGQGRRVGGITFISHRNKVKEGNVRQGRITLIISGHRAQKKVRDEGGRHHNKVKEGRGGGRDHSS